METDPAQIMGTDPAQIKYDQMKTASLLLICDDLHDLPCLKCLTCGQLASFGGNTTFNLNIFTKFSVCICSV